LKIKGLYDLFRVALFCLHVDCIQTQSICINDALRRLPQLLLPPADFFL
jgi:hypothetical protein